MNEIKMMKMYDIWIMSRNNVWCSENENNNTNGYKLYRKAGYMVVLKIRSRENGK